MSKKTDIKQIARLAGVSIATVSRALNDKNNVKESTRKKILDLAGELNYQPNQLARGLSRRKTETIGVILPDLEGEFFMEIIHSIDEEVHRAKRHVLVSSSHSQRKYMETILEYMNSGRVDGIILFAPQMTSDIVQMLNNSRRPLVLLNAPKEVRTVVSFDTDNYQGSFLLTAHMIGHGYRDIGFIKGSAGNSEAEERFRGYQAALNEANIPLNPRLVAQGRFDLPSGYEAFMHFFNQSPKPRAIIAANDFMALGAYQAADRLKLDIPGDVALGGFDDIFTAKFVRPPLTTIHVKISAICRRAVRHLIRMIDGEVESQKPFRETFSTELVLGGSCGCNAEKPVR